MNTSPLTAVFRADASTGIGGGHIVRSLALATALADRDWDCIFAVSAESLVTVPALKKSGFAVIEVTDNNMSTVITSLPHGSADYLIVDHYRLDETFHRNCRPWADSIIVIDELADRRLDCDFLIDLTPGRPPGDYIDLVPDKCRLLLGPAFALIRPEFRQHRELSLSRRKPANGLKTLLVSFGAVDAHNLTSIAIRAIEESGLDVTVDVILGAAAVHINHVKKLITDSRVKFRLHYQTDNMAGMMAAADLAIGAAGTTAWERCSLGLPSLLVIDAENQARIAVYLDRANAAVLLGRTDDVTVPGTTKALQRLFNEPSALQHLSTSASEICDGRGVERLTAELDR